MFKLGYLPLYNYSGCLTSFLLFMVVMFILSILLPFLKKENLPLNKKKNVRYNVANFIS